ncbi:zinc finger protein, partial [Aphelenchoides avenae]
MSGVNEKLFSIGCYRQISAQEAQCIPCSAGSAKPKRFKTDKHSSTTLLKHLPKHPEYLKKFEDLKSEQPTVMRFLTTPTGSLTALDRKVRHLVASCNLSFNTINHPMFPLSLPSPSNRNNEGRVSLPDESAPTGGRPRIQSLLEHCQFLSFTSDVWSGPCNSFISLTVHGITKEWHRFMFVLAFGEFSGSHIAERIEQIIYDLLREWDLDRERVHVILHDQASSMISHCRRLLLTNKQWSMLMEMRDFLKPLKELNKVLCRDASSICMRIAVGHAIATELKLYKGEVLKDEIRRMIVIHNSKFVGLEKYRTHAVAHFLDPRFKDKVISDADAASQFRIYARECITACANEMAEPEDAIHMLTASPQKKNSFL